MATVVNKADPGGKLDKKISSPNRKIAGNPLSSVTPLYAGEIVLDSSTGNMWYALDLTNTGWTPASTIF